MKPVEWFLLVFVAGVVGAVLFPQKASELGGVVLEVVGMRGIRNNNPGNLRHSATSWQGMSVSQTDPEFVQFVSAEYGIRALSKLLDTYSVKYGLNTVSGIIGRYAPSVENDTGSYINSVASYLGIDRNQPFDVQARKSELVRAIIRHENGLNPYSVATINSGISMA